MNMGTMDCGLPPDGGGRRIADSSLIVLCLVFDLTNTLRTVVLTFTPDGFGVSYFSPLYLSVVLIHFPVSPFRLSPLPYLLSTFLTPPAWPRCEEQDGTSGFCRYPDADVHDY